MRETGTARLIPAAVLAALLPTLAAFAATPQVATVHTSGNAVSWQPQIDRYDRLSLTVAGPGGTVTREFRAGETPSFSLYDAAGQPLADGLYKWELRATPLLDAATRRAMIAERQAGTESVAEELRTSGALPGATYQSGAFSVIGGALVVPGDVEEDAGGGVRSTSGAVRSTSAEVVLTNANGVIRNALCVGSVCPDAPAFGDSSVLMMENNNRIKFGDTSNSPFPNNDWEIEANSSSSGGASYLGFNDCGTADNDGGCTTDLVFAVEAGAPQNALYVESDGDVGLGTSNPVLDLHIVSGNSPAIRLEQNGSGGFSPQSWDITGNETNFFVRDVTNGSTLPFRIQPGTASNTLWLDADDRVGIGTTSPAAPLEVQSSGSGLMLQLEGAGDVFFRQLNSTSGQFVDVNLIGNEMRVNFGTGGAGPELRLDNNGNLIITGSYTPDYVFENDYPLLTLDELGSFIDQNKHLPNVPSDADVKATRQINVVEFQMRLLEKIEELTLYTLQQHETIETQQAGIAELRAEVAELKAAAKTH